MSAPIPMSECGWAPILTPPGTKPSLGPTSWKRCATARSGYRLSHHDLAAVHALTFPVHHIKELGHTVPRFFEGHGMGVGYLVFNVLVVGKLWWIRKRENERRDLGSGHRAVEGDRRRRVAWRWWSAMEIPDLRIWSHAQFSSLKWLSWVSKEVRRMEVLIGRFAVIIFTSQVRSNL